MYEKLLCGPLLANRTVVLVTHHVELVPPGAKLVRLFDGRIDTQDPIQDLRAKCIPQSITLDAAVEVKKGELEEAAVAGDRTSSMALRSRPSKRRRNRASCSRMSIVRRSVKWSMYKSYLKASSYWTWVILSILIVVIQLLGVGEKLWIKTWVEDTEPTEQHHPSTHFDLSQQRNLKLA